MQTGIATRRECKSCVRASVCEWLVASGEWLLSEEGVGEHMVIQPRASCSVSSRHMGPRPGRRRALAAIAAAAMQCNVMIEEPGDRRSETCCPVSVCGGIVPRIASDPPNV